MSLWSEPLLLGVAGRKTDGWQAIGKVVQGVTFTRDWIPAWKLEDWGYGRNKIAQLERNYVNQEEFDRVRAVLARRGVGKYTSVALSLRGKPKDTRSQGWCMLSMVISRTKEWTRIEVQYRTTELILKFAADIWFLHRIIERLKLPEVDRFTFRFANCALSGAYFPYLVDKINLVEFLKDVHKLDKEFFFRTTRFLLKSSYKKDQFHPFSPERLSHRFLWERATARQIQGIRDFLEPLHRQTGRPLPRDFHTKDYIPKGKRNAQTEETLD